MGRTTNGNVVAIGDHLRNKPRLSPQESANVLTGCRELALERMAQALGSMLDRVEDELFELANRTQDREAQNLYLDARSQARDKRAAIESTFRRHFVEFFNRKVSGEPAAAASARAEELTLVDDGELEASIALGEMSRKMKAACEGELFALQQRMGFLLQRADMADDANPLSPATVCAALKDACDQIPSSHQVRMALLQRLESHTEAALHEIYRDVNAHLVARSILPDVRPTARRSPAAPRREEPAPAPSREAPAIAQDIFSTLAQLLNGSPPDAGGLPAAMPARAAPAFLAELTRLHREAAPAAAEPGTFVNVVKGLKEAPQAATLGELDAMTIDLVAMLFDYVFEDRHIPSSVKGLLGRLQIPTLKVALLDRGFFSSKSHPARRLIDRLAEASIGLDESNVRGSATLEMVEGVVEKVRHDFETDLACFESMVARVEEFIAEQKRAEEDIVQRSARVIEERERQEIARLIGEEEVHRRLQAHALVPAVVRQMLLEHWPRALASVYLIEGEGTRAWNNLAATVEELLWSVEPKAGAEDRKRLVTQLPAMLRQLQTGMERAQMTQAERDAFMGALVDCHAAAVKAGLRGLAVVPEATPPVPLPAQDPTLERQMLPAGDVQVEEIRLRTGPARNVFTRTGVWTNLQRGTWVEFRRAEAAARARLTWISPNRGVYLFTNPLSGAIAVSISPEALAEQMRLGEARLLDDAPLVERAVNSMMESLRRTQAVPAQG